MRCLRLINKINWKMIGPSSFVTLMYPDWRLCMNQRQRSSHRAQFMREIERYCKGPVASFWKIEWMERLSGHCVGMMAPHFHMMLFDVPWIPKESITGWWTRILQSEKDVYTDIKKVKGAEGAGKYLGKYVSKSCEHVIAAYHNNTFMIGRPWGTTRKEMFPLSPVDVNKGLSDAKKRQLQEYAKKQFPNYDAEKGGGFTLLGDEHRREILKIEKDSP